MQHAPGDARGTLSFKPHNSPAREVLLFSSHRRQAGSCGLTGPHSPSFPCCPPYCPPYSRPVLCPALSSAATRLQSRRATWEVCLKAESTLLTSPPQGPWCNCSKDHSLGTLYDRCSRPSGGICLLSLGSLETSGLTLSDGLAGATTGSSTDIRGQRPHLTPHTPPGSAPC